MRTRITVLDSRPGAKHPWPACGTMYDPETRAQCCIGQQGRQNAGIPVEDLNIPLPGSLAANIPWEWQELWDQRVPLRVIGSIQEAANSFVSWDNAEDVASQLNDDLAHGHGRPADAVAGLRILWRWLGETQGERWIIRWYRPPENGEG